MRRPRACLAHTPSGRLGSASGPTTWLCLQWLDADRMKAGESQPDRGACRACPVPEARSPRPKSPPNSSQACADCVNLSAERRKAMRFPSHGKRNNIFAPRGAPRPSPFQGARPKLTSRVHARERRRVAFVRANGASPTRACCLKIESVTRRATDSLSALPPIDCARAIWPHTAPCRPLRPGLSAAAMHSARCSPHRC